MKYRVDVFARCRDIGLLELAGKAGCCKATSIELAWRIRRASRSFLVLLRSVDLTPSRTLSGNPSPTIKQQQFISCRTFYQYTAKQSTFLGTAGYLQRQLSSQLVHSEPQGACEALLNSRVQEQIAPFLQQTIQRSRTHWPYEENMPKEEVYGDDQCRVQ